MINILNKKSKLNNRGMTLVEVIVAVAILSIAILPLMYSFVYSTRFNMEAREKQRATSAAEAIIEKFKGNSLGEIKNEFTSATPVFTVGSNAYTTGTTEYKVAPLTGETRFLIKNMSYEANPGAGSKLYDAVVKVETHPGASDKYSSEVYPFKYDNKFNDAVYKGVDTDDYEAYDHALQEVQIKYGMLTDKDPSAVFDPTKMEVRRKLMLTVGGSKATGYKVVANLVYTYKVPSSTYPKVGGGTGTFTVLEDTLVPDLSLRGYTATTDPVPGYLIYDGTDSSMVGKATLDRLFIYYFPLYKADGRNKIIEDEISISDISTRSADETIEKKLEVYVYKQRRKTISDAELQLQESSATNIPAKVIAKNGSLRLFHNLDKSVYDYTSSSPFTISNIILDHTNRPAEANGYFVSGSMDKEGVIDVLSDVTVQIYDQGGVDMSANGAASGARLIAEIKSTINGKK